jgi:hypothetical protein
MQSSQKTSPSDALLRFAEFIDAVNPMEPILPVTHVTDAYIVQKLTQSNSLLPSNCPVFDEPLLYFFYGRPSYRANSNSSNTSSTFMAPVCLIFNNSLLEHAYRIYPFDTGAYQAGLFTRFLHPLMKLDDFELSLNSLSPAKLVSIFYENNTGYYDANPKPKSNNATAFPFEMDAYSALIGYTSAEKFDDRNSTVEIQVRKPVSIDSLNLKAAVVPSSLADKSYFRAALRIWGADLVVYSWTNRMKPNEYTSQIFNLVRDYLQSEGLF